jgi:hypothetical protein
MRKIDKIGVNYTLLHSEVLTDDVSLNLYSEMGVYRGEMCYDLALIYDIKGDFYMDNCFMTLSDKEELLRVARETGSVFFRDRLKHCPPFLKFAFYRIKSYEKISVKNYVKKRYLWNDTTALGMENEYFQFHPEGDFEILDEYVPQWGYYRTIATTRLSLSDDYAWLQRFVGDSSFSEYVEYGGWMQKYLFRGLDDNKSFKLEKALHIIDKYFGTKGEFIAPDRKEWEKTKNWIIKNPSQMCRNFDVDDFLLSCARFDEMHDEYEKNEPCDARRLEFGYIRWKV